MWNQAREKRGQEEKMQRKNLKTIPSILLVMLISAALIAGCASGKMDTWNLEADLPENATMIAVSARFDEFGRPSFIPLAQRPQGEGKQYTLAAFERGLPIMSLEVEVVEKSTATTSSPLLTLGAFTLMAVPMGVIVGVAIVCPDDPEASEQCTGDKDDFRLGFIIGALGTIGLGIYKSIQEATGGAVVLVETLKAQTTYKHDELGRLIIMMTTYYSEEGQTTQSKRFHYQENDTAPYKTDTYQYEPAQSPPPQSETISGVTNPI